MKDIKHHQADDYEDKIIARKNTNCLSSVPAFQPGANVAPAGVQASPAGASKACTPVDEFVLPMAPTLRKIRRSKETINMRRSVLLAVSLAALSGCSAWSSNPVRTQANYGASVRNMVSNQIYNPDKAQNPDALLPDGMDGDKTDSVLNKTYRGLVFVPREDLRHTTTYGQPNISILGGSGGAAR
ncbi:lipoprotein [Candidatus Methylobacter oryzae]|uniref:Type IV secretion system putative lipoprotein virB7 n=1 Tax=Candidatus Methylobacter oryzae TaxID=2497749 RepID=A0ABY3C4T5_9GAMM|nr:lipoprotein [Candidatus Methylobacter oryzae]TRW89693.1 hypothetical protein EKO24_021845 [Candidatus Methylobacter oryzae]